FCCEHRSFQRRGGGPFGGALSRLASACSVGGGGGVASRSLGRSDDIGGLWSDGITALLGTDCSSIGVSGANATRLSGSPETTIVPAGDPSVNEYGSLRPLARNGSTASAGTGAPAYEVGATDTPTGNVCSA